jgi:hypothetical protein
MQELFELWGAEETPQSSRRKLELFSGPLKPPYCMALGLAVDPPATWQHGNECFHTVIINILNDPGGCD